MSQLPKVRSGSKPNGELGFAPIPILIITAIISLAFFKEPIIKTLANLNSALTPTPPPQVQIASPSAQMTDPKKLEKYLTVEAALLGVSNNVSIYFKDLAQDQNISVDPEKSWIPASTIKAYVAIEAFRQRNLGLIDFNQLVTIQANNVVSTELETDEFPRLREGTAATIGQLVQAMIIQSDNTAYNTLLDILDRRTIDLTLRQLGLTETVVGEKLNLDDNQFQQDLTVPGKQPNTTTAKDYATLFDLLYNKQIPNSDEILAVFKRQKINDMIPAMLPPNTQVAHKTGDWAPIYHDGGVVYKPNDPFIFVSFTNSNDPTIIAQLARVAYFRSADYVGKSVENVKPQSQNRPIYTLAEGGNSQVLGEVAAANQKFPEITAADLGITLADLAIDKPDGQKIGQALVMPGSLLYGVKQFFEDLQTSLSITPNQRTNNDLNQALNRLSEVKTALSRGDLTTGAKTLNQAADDLKRAVDQVKNTGSNQDVNLTKIQQASDLNYAVLADIAPKIPTDKKEQFIDLVYNFYKRNQQEVMPTVQKSIIANPVGQKPAIGTVSQIQNGNATVEFDDGSTRQVVLTNTTPVRNFGQTNLTDTKALQNGDKIAVIGTTATDGKIVPRFILNSVPKELPQKHEGTVIEINPNQNTLEIKDKTGQIQQINIQDTTVVQSKDTNVSLEGIKTGSVVTVYGQYTGGASASASAISTPQASSKATLPNQKRKSPSPSSSAPLNLQPQLIIKATSITVTVNGSGRQEMKTQPKSQLPKPPKKD